MTLAEWKRALKPGMKLTCVYRWYWEKTPSKKPAGGKEEITISQVRTTQMIYAVNGGHQNNYMDFPRASELKADEKGFELYFPLKPDAPMAGQLMSRYEWAKEVPCTV